MDIKKGLYIYSFSIIFTLFAHTSESLGEPRQTWIKLLKREVDRTGPPLSKAEPPVVWKLLRQNEGWMRTGSDV